MPATTRRRPTRRKRRYVETDAFLEMLGRMVQAAGKRAGDADPEQLGLLVSIRGDLDRAILTAVRGLRHDGFTWESLGEATGTTRQAAVQKWARFCEPPAVGDGATEREGR